jgi:hypothetical protein
MASIIILIFENPELAKHLGAAGIENVRKQFSLERNISSLQEILNN